jgi:hypothetical protein
MESFLWKVPSECDLGIGSVGFPRKRNFYKPIGSWRNLGIEFWLKEVGEKEWRQWRHNYGERNSYAVLFKPSD